MINIGKIKTCQVNYFTFSSVLGGVSRFSSSWVCDVRVGFQFGSSEKGFYISFDSSEKPQKNTRCSQVSVRPLKVRRRRVGESWYQVNSGYWKFISPKSQNEWTELVGIRSGAREGCFPMCSRILEISSGSVLKVMIHYGFHTCCSKSGDRFRRFYESISLSLKASAYRKSQEQPPPRLPRSDLRSFRV